MRKRASGSQIQISSLPEGLKRPRRRKTPDDALAQPSTTTQAAQIHRPSRPRKRKAAEDGVRPMPELSSCTNNQAAQTQILPSRVAAEPKSINLRPCSDAAAAQVRLRPPSSTSLFWGAKRSRTHLGRREWSNLDEGPAGLIAERLLANDVADYVRFRAVCGPWRRCCSDPRSHAVLEDRRFHPRRWIMLIGEREELKVATGAAANRCRRRHFLNVSTGKCIQVDIPELRDHGVLRSTTQGLLLLFRNAAEPLRLLNPLTRQAAELPPITTISSLGGGSCSPAYIGGGCSPSSAGLVDDDHTVLLYFCNDGVLAFAKPGDERWVVVKTEHRLIPTMTFAGRFYGVTGYTVMVVDTTRGDKDLPPRLVVAANLARPVCGMVDTVHLVDNGGELMLVHRLKRPNRNRNNRVYKVYRVNLVVGKTTPAAARGRAIFIGLFRALSVPPHVFPSLSANTVYPGLIFDERGGDKQIGAYHLKDGSTESFNYNSQSGLAHPWTIADCLAAYVSG